jgi:uncharacterized iron-regulated protein
LELPSPAEKNISQVDIINEIEQREVIHIGIIHFTMERELLYLKTLSTIFPLYRGGVLLMEETGVPGENHRPVSSH